MNMCICMEIVCDFVSHNEMLNTTKREKSLHMLYVVWQVKHTDTCVN